MVVDLYKNGFYGIHVDVVAIRSDGDAVKADEKKIFLSH